MHNILLDIIEKKKIDLSQQKKVHSESNFKAAFNSVGIKIITEIKLASPTVPSLGSEDQVVQRAVEYEEAGADAISVITEKHYFKGSTDFIVQLKNKIRLPILQKDFVIDPYQIYEAKIIGSDAILLIAQLLDKTTLKRFVDLAQKIGIEPVVEINDVEDLDKALGTSTSFIAVNARDLTTFEVSIDKACGLLRVIPDSYIKLGFSGVQSSKEVKKYKDAGANGVLVGTSLMKSANISHFIKSLQTI